MQEKLTERTLRAISFAQMEAVRRRKNAVGPEHLLLGLLRDKGCAACRILERYTGIRAEDLERVARKPMPVRTPTETAARETLKQGKDMPLNPNGKWVMDVAYEEAQRLGNNYVGTEHLLLGILQSDECILLQVLNREFVLMLEEARSVIIHHLRNSKDPKKEVTVIRFLTSDGPMSLPLNAVKEMTVKTKNGDYTGRFMEVATEQATPPKPPQMPPADNTVQDDPPFPPGLGI